MAVYKPTYRDPKTGKAKQQRVWWYHFTFAGRHIQESSKSSRKTIAQEAEKKRRMELERGFNNVEDKRAERIQTVIDIGTAFMEGYRLRNPRSTTFADYTWKHVTKHLGKMMSVDVSDAVVRNYQTARLKEKAAPKSVNDEVGMLLRVLGEQGDYLRAKLRRAHVLKLKVTTQVARAFTEEEKEKLLEAAKARRSPVIYPALMLALHTGLRDAGSEAYNGDGWTSIRPWLPWETARRRQGREGPSR